jgi:hypothetical protein
MDLNSVQILFYFSLNSDFQRLIINFCVVPFIHFDFRKPSSFDMTQFQKGLSLSVSGLKKNQAVGWLLKKLQSMDLRFSFKVDQLFFKN